MPPCHSPSWALIGHLKLWEDVALQRVGSIHFTKRNKVTLMKPGPIASPDPSNCHGSLSLARASLGGLLVLSTWNGSDGSLRSQTPGRLPVVSNLNMGVHTEAVCSHHLLRCETSQKYLCRCCVVVAQQASGEIGLVCPQEVPVTQTASHPTPCPTHPDSLPPMHTI